MKRISALVIAVLLLAGGALSQNSATQSAAAQAPQAQAPQASAPDAAALTQLLRDFLAGAGRNDAAMHDRFWADELVYTGSSGRRLGKAELMRGVRSAAPAKPGEPVTVYSAEDVRIMQFGDTAIVAFRLVGATTRAVGAGLAPPSGDPRVAPTPEISNYLNTGTFLKRNGQWRVVAWQATKLPKPEESEKK